MEIHLLLMNDTYDRREISHLAKSWAVERLTSYVGGKVEWAVDPWGKPYLFSHPWCYFNLAHSGRLAIIVIDHAPVGVDIEEMRIRDYEALGKRFFHPEEREWIRGDKKRFYEVWTAKEAYLKAKGIGIRIRLSSFSVIGARVLKSPEGEWFLFPLDLGESFCEYQGCVCCRRKPEEKTQIMVWKKEEDNCLLYATIDKNGVFSLL